MQTEGKKHPSAPLKSSLFKEVLNDLPMIVLLCDLKGKLLYGNSQFEKQLGYAIEPYKGGRVWELFKDEEINRIFFKALLRDLILHKEAVFRATLTHQAGRKVRVSVQAVLVDSQSVPKCIILSVSDIGEQIKLERQLLEIAEHERLKVGQELHDSLGQSLSATSLISEHLIKSYKRSGSLSLEELEGLAEMIRDTNRLSRQIAHGLSIHTLALHGHSLEAAIQHLCERYNRNSELRCTYSFRYGNDFSDPTKLVHMYRIVEEAIHNAIKHGGANIIQVRLDYDEQFVKLRVEDNGKGFPQKEDLDHAEGMGIHSMQYRAELMGGNLQLRELREGWTSVECTVPVKREPENRDDNG